MVYFDLCINKMSVAEHYVQALGNVLQIRNNFMESLWLGYLWHLKAVLHNVKSCNKDGEFVIKTLLFRN